MAKTPNLSPEQRDRIAALRQRRWNIPSIAAEIGCSEGSVSWCLLIQGVDIHEGRTLPPVPVEPVIYSRTGYSVRRFTVEEDARLIAMEAQGLNLHRIAIALGRKRNAVVGRLATLARRDARSEAA